jgi:mono/diheme cytochrome c family protein
MTTSRPVAPVVLVCLACLAPAVGAAEPDAAERGRKALLERPLLPGAILSFAYERAWQQWGDGRKEPPPAYAEAFAERYGLHPAPYPNHGYPMGLREAPGLLGKWLTVDCLLCHGGSIAGQSYVGLGNASLDYQSLYEELAAAAGAPRKPPFTFSTVRGTTEAASMAVYLLARRNPDLKLRRTPLKLPLSENLCEDPPAWWLLKKKRTMYHTASSDARSVRSLMQFLMTPLNPGESITREEETFRDIQAYLLSLQPPKYPFPIDRSLARVGKEVFLQNCATCHGTYGERWTYPNKVVPLDLIGTDRARYDGICDEAGRYYNQTWFAREKGGWLGDEYAARKSAGYQAPPLDGIWATAPYFHNGSVPTVYHVLNSEARPRVFTRSFRTDEEAYDPVKLGWKVQVLDREADPGAPAIERRKVYDTTKPGRGNGGHTFGDDLTDQERMAVIEYLKTL